MPSAAELIQIVDATMAEAVRKSGSWIACRAGCCHCCLGPFPITPWDAARLREGLADLAIVDPQRAARVTARALDAVARLPEFPARLDEDKFEALIESLPEEEPCPALDPIAGTCELYEFRPITCRTFGPAVQLGGDAVGACELCYDGASDEVIADCTVQLDIAADEAELSGSGGPTLVALALVSTPARCPSST